MSSIQQQKPIMPIMMEEKRNRLDFNKDSDNILFPIAAVGFFALAARGIYGLRKRGGLDNRMSHLIHTRMAAQGFAVGLLYFGSCYMFGKELYHYIHRKPKSNSPQSSEKL